MVSFYGERTYTCEKCGGESLHPFTQGLCGTCTYKELISHVNGLCDTCKNKCKQTALVSIAKCPTYTPKMPPDAQKGPVLSRSVQRRLAIQKEPKKALKQTKRKK